MYISFVKTKLPFMVFMMVVMMACSHQNNQDETPTTSGDLSSNLEDDTWRALTNSGDILMGIEFSGVTATLTVVNLSSGTVGAPSLTTYDLSTGEASPLTNDSAGEIEAGSSYQGSFTFPGSSSPEDSALITVSLGGEEAAVFIVSDTYSSLSPAYFDPTLSSYISPNPGTWNFEMQLGSNFLQGTECPTDSSGSFTSSGDATLYVSNNGLSAMWILDSSVVTFHRSATSQDFESPHYSFPVELEEGMVYGTNQWVITPSSQTSITGILEWDNSLGCSAEYPITMDFESLSNPSTIALCEGIWNITYDPIICGANVIPLGSVPLLPSSSGSLDVTYSLATPGFLSFESFSGYQVLPNLGGTNIYGTGLPNMTLGATTDVLGSPLVIVGGIQMIALSPTSIQGVLTVNGYGLNPCTGTSVFSMSSASGC